MNIKKINIISICLLSFGLTVPLKYSTENTGSLLAAKPKVKWHRNGATLVKRPSDYKPPPAQKKIFKTPFYIATIYAMKFRAGQPAYLQIKPVKARKFYKGHSFEVTFNTKKVHLSETSYGFHGMIALHPETKTGSKILNIVHRYKKTATENSFRVYVARTKFPVFTSGLDLGRFSKVSTKKKKPSKKFLDFLKMTREKKKKAFGLFTADKLDRRVSHPRNMHKITSAYWAKRVTKRYKVVDGKRKYLKSRVHIHRGLDLRGYTGTPIYAMARGKVVIARKMHWEGYFTLIDHGKKVFSGYMHQSKILVKEGQWVKAGQYIGKVGATGAVTGAHLHVSWYVAGIPVDPLGILSLPIRN